MSFQQETEVSLENKALPYAGQSTQDPLSSLMSDFELFKSTNEQRLQELEQRGHCDGLTEEKLNRLNQALDLHKKSLDAVLLQKKRPPLDKEEGGRGAPHRLAHKDAFHAYIRYGTLQAPHGLSYKALSASSDPDGGYTIPEETETEILTRLRVYSPLRSIAGIRQVSASVYKKPVCVEGPAAGWVGETQPRPQTASPTLSELHFPTMELYAMPAATATLLEDSTVDIDSWIADEVETVFASQESAAFVHGDGVTQPQGFLKSPQSGESQWRWGTLETRSTGTEGGLGDHASDGLVDLIYALKAGYRQNAHWMMNRRTQAEIRKLKDAQGHYLWAPPTTPGSTASLMNFPLVESEDMPDMTPNATPIAFGDFRRGYLIVDRMGLRILRDPYSAKPYVLFYTTKRVGGGVQDFDAIKLLKIAAS